MWVSTPQRLVVCGRYCSASGWPRGCDGSAVMLRITVFAALFLGCGAGLLDGDQATPYVQSDYRNGQFEYARRDQGVLATSALHVALREADGTPKRSYGAEIRLTCGATFI